MEFKRTFDYELVRQILIQPSIYPHAGDDYSPPRSRFQPNKDTRIWYVTIRSEERRIGLYMLIPDNTVCWEIHVAMQPDASADEKWCAARQFIPWLEEHSVCKRLAAHVPASNRKAIMYGIHGFGMHYVGRHEKAFMKNGKLQDLIILGREIRGVYSA